MRTAAALSAAERSKPSDAAFNPASLDCKIGLTINRN
jgi:hypothetical protein